MSPSPVHPDAVRTGNVVSRPRRHEEHDGQPEVEVPTGAPPLLRSADRRARRLVLFCASCALRKAARLLPARPHVVVYGFPATEGNAVEVVRALDRRYRGRTYWIGAPAPAVVDRLGLGASRSVRAVAKRSLRGVWAYLTAEAVLLTHGFFGDPAPTRRKAVVNLWHGDGLKVNRRALPPATYVVGSTTLLTGRKAADAGMGAERALVVGNPRTDRLFAPAGPAALRRLGIPADRPFVLWMPTFRQTRQAGLMPGWSDLPDTGASDDQLRDVLTVTARELDERGIALVVKPHPMDASERSVPGARFVDDASLTEHSVPLYALLGASAGLITDFSSVMTDYLLLDRPIGFVLPDAEQYLEGRGLWPPDAMQWLPGRTLSAPSDVRAFADEVTGVDRTGTAALRAGAAERLGLVRTTTAADDLLDALAERGELARGGLLPRDGREGA